MLHPIPLALKTHSLYPLFQIAITMGCVLTSLQTLGDFCPRQQGSRQIEGDAQAHERSNQLLHQEVEAVPACLYMHKLRISLHALTRLPLNSML